MAPSCYANSAFAEMLGYSAEEVLSPKFDQILPTPWTRRTKSALSLVTTGYADIRSSSWVHQGRSIRRGEDEQVGR
jgi:PAS domain-containing protein